MNLLKLGNRGAEVTQLQLALNAVLNPSPKLAADGDFGDDTQRAVIRYQKSKGLTPDGVVGSRTWSALGQKAAPVAEHKIAPPATPASPWLPIARSQIGQREFKTPGMHNNQIIAYHQTTTLRATADEVAWCSSFVNWVMIQSGRRGTNSAAAASWLNWGAPLQAPQAGAITVIKQKSAGKDHATGSTSGFHVAFFLSITDKHIKLLGGNQRDQVREADFPLRSYEVKGYRWPAQ